MAALEGVPGPRTSAGPETQFSLRKRVPGPLRILGPRSQGHIVSQDSSESRDLERGTSSLSLNPSLSPPSKTQCKAALPFPHSYWVGALVFLLPGIS
jgi:hypothetical protein